MKKKLLSTVLSVAMLATALAGCGSSDAATTDSAASENTAADTAADAPVDAQADAVTTVGDANGTHMECWSFVEAHNTFYAQMVEKWNAANPDRTIEITFTTYPYSDMHTKLLTSLTAGTGAPFHVGATVMYWNMAVLEEAGITQADVDAVVTWDDYNALGEKYLEAIGRPEGKYFTSVDTAGVDWMWIAMAEYGEDWTGGHNGTANVELDSVKKMLTMQQGWINSGFAQTSPDGHVDLEAGFQNILDHNIVSFPKAMWFMSRFTNYMPEEKGNWYITSVLYLKKDRHVL